MTCTFSMISSVFRRLPSPCSRDGKPLPYEGSAPHVGLIARRMNALHHIRTAPQTCLVTSIAALMQRLLPVTTFTHTTLQFKLRGTIEREALTGGLLRLGYHRVSVVEIPGEFSIRGGIVDIFSTAYADPLRVEFLGETVDSLRLFDPATQKSTAKLDRAVVLPAREYLRAETSPDALAPIPADAEWRAPDLYPDMDTLFDYFTEQPILVLDQPAALTGACADLWSKIDDGYLRHADRETSRTLPVTGAVVSLLAGTHGSHERLAHARPRAAHRERCVLESDPDLSRSDPVQRRSRGSWDALQPDPGHHGSLARRSAAWCSSQEVAAKWIACWRSYANTMCRRWNGQRGPGLLPVKPKRRFTSCAAIYLLDSSHRTCAWSF